nr:MAG TPA: hypothetical protein [Caudoviricetes sp.]
MRTFKKYKSLVFTMLVVTVTAVVTNVLTAKLVCSVAYTERGYAAVGGEWILICILCVLEWRGLAWCSRTFWKWVRGGGRDI